MTITQNNVQNVKFLRNGNLFETRETAKSTLKGFTVDNEKDGTAILARYSGGTIGGEDFFIKTLVGFVYANGDNKSVTVFDIDDVGSDVQKAIDEINTKIGTGVTTVNTVTAQLAALSGTPSDTSSTTSVEGAKKYAKEYTDTEIGKLEYTGVTTGTGVYIKNVTQSDGNVSATTATLPSVSVISAAGKPITAVSESLGVISASAGTIDGEYVMVGGGSTGSRNVESAIASIDGNIGNIRYDIVTINNTIYAMDLNVVSGDGKVITAVSENDGKVSANATAIKDVKLTGYVKDTSKTGAISETDDVEDALSKLENTVGANKISNSDGSIVVTEPTGTATTTDVKVNIKSGDKVIKLDASKGGIYTNLNLVKITDSIPTTVKERYEFRDSDGNKIGESIDIAKDSHIVSITYNETTQKLIYKYLDASGVEQTTEVDMAHLILETEVENGIQSVQGKLSIKLDTTGDDTGDGKFLTVGANGLKLDGVTDAITAAIESLDASVSGGTTAGTASSNHVQVVVDEVNGKLTAVTVNEANIADADDLAALSAKTVTEIGSSNSSIAVATATTTASNGTVKYDVITDASKIQMSGFTAAESGFTTIEQFSSVTEAFKAVETIFIDTEETISASLNDLEDRKAEKTELQSEFNTLSDRISDLESGSSADLAAEIAARKAVDGQSGQTYAANSGKKYISGATSLNGADIALNDALDALDADVIKSVKVNNVALDETDNAVYIKIAAGSTAANDGNAIHVDTANNGDITITLGTIDAGTY